MSQVRICINRRVHFFFHTIFSFFCQAPGSIQRLAHCIFFLSPKCPNSLIREKQQPLPQISIIHYGSSLPSASDSPPLAARRSLPLATRRLPPLASCLSPFPFPHPCFRVLVCIVWFEFFAFFFFLFSSLTQCWFLAGTGHRSQPFTGHHHHDATHACFVVLFGMGLASFLAFFLLVLFAPYFPFFFFFLMMYFSFSLFFGMF